MANEIYHRSNWGNAVNANAWGDVYQKFDATNEMFIRSDNYENSNETDKLMAAINPKPSILLTPTAYDNGSLHSVKPVKTFGSELIDLTQGTAEQPSQWSNITTNSVTFLSGAAGTRYFNVISTQSTLISGKKYSLTLEISNYSGSGNLGLSTQGGVSINARFDTNGTNSEVFTSNGQSLRIFGRTTNSATITLSVKEITEADFDFTRGTIATLIAENGLIEDVTDTNLPRIDYTSGTGQILLEPQSTNLVTDSAGGNYGNNPASEILTTAPDGTNTAVRPVPDSTSDRYQYTISGGSYATDSKLTYTWYRKRITTPIDTSHTGDLKIQILVNCTQVGSTTQIETDVNGFDRFQAVFNITDGSASTLIRGYFGQSIGVGNSSIAYWGHQVEPLEFSTSLIPTSGSTSTRNADVCNNAGSSDLINSTEGVLYAEIAALADNLTFRSIALSDGTLDNRVIIRYRTTSNRINIIVEGSNVVAVNSTQVLTDITNYSKFALKYKSGDIALWVDGVEVFTDLTTFTITGLDRLTFDGGGGADDFYGKVKSVAVYKEALTDAQLTALTT